MEITLSAVSTSVSPLHWVKCQEFLAVANNADTGKCILGVRIIIEVA